MDKPHRLTKISLRTGTGWCPTCKDTVVYQELGGLRVCPVLTLVELEQQEAASVLVKRFGTGSRGTGLHHEDIPAQLEKQGHKCGLCGDPIVKFHRDHDHAKKKFRSLLCVHCNIGLGHFKDDPRRLEKAIVYLKLHGID